MNNPKEKEEEKKAITPLRISEKHSNISFSYFLSRYGSRMSHQFYSLWEERNPCPILGEQQPFFQLKSRRLGNASRGENQEK